MTWFKNTAIGFLLLFSSLMIILSTLFYNVSAVIVFEKHQRNLFMSTFEGLHNYTDCSWVSSVLITDKVMTLECKTPLYGLRVLYVNEKYQILTSIDPNEIKLSEASSVFTAMNNSTSFSISTTTYKNEIVYWISSDDGEWLLDFIDYSILWKVDKNYE